MTSSNNQMHNDIMAVRSRERPSMLAPDRFTLEKLRSVHTRITIRSVDAEKRLDRLTQEFGRFTSRDGESFESYYTRFYKTMNGMFRNKLIVDTMLVNVQFLQQLHPEWSRFVINVKQQQNLDKVSYHTLFDILKQHHNEVNEIRAERIAENTNLLTLVAATQPYPDTYPQAPQAPKPYKTYAPSSI
nr:hypothetical protein [Tanacetum cinerariifolium]